MSRKPAPKPKPVGFFDWLFGSTPAPAPKPKQTGLFSWLFDSKPVSRETAPKSQGFIEWFFSSPTPTPKYDPKKWKSFTGKDGKKYVELDVENPDNFFHFWADPPYTQKDYEADRAKMSQYDRDQEDWLDRNM